MNNYRAIFFKESNKMDKLLARLNKKKRKHKYARVESKYVI